MNNKRKIWIVLAAFLILVVTVVLFLDLGGSSNEEDSNNQNYLSRNWKSQYHTSLKNPYDLYHFNELLMQNQNKRSLVKNLNTVYDFDTLKRGGDRVYIFVGKMFGSQMTEIEEILTDVDSGATFILAFDDLYSSSYSFFFNRNEFLFDYSSKIQINDNKQKYTFQHIFQTDTTAHWWRYFDESALKFNKYRVLSSSFGLANSIDISYGKGNIILHTMPELFQNYQVLTKNGYKYTVNFLNNVPKNKAVYWMEFCRLADDIGDYQNEDEKEIDKSYLQFILNNRSTRAAFFVAILAIILFLIFRTTRVQPIVPVIEKKKNMTVAYTETITGIFYSKRNPYGLLAVLRKNFYNTVSRQFFIDLNRKEDRNIERLAEKTNFPFNELKSLIDKFETTKAFSVDENYLAEVSNLQRRFYKETGIITDNTIEQLERRLVIFNRAIWIGAAVVLTAIAFVLFGFYFLSASFNSGVAALPIGFLLLLLGVQYLRIPIISLSKENIIFHSIFTKKKAYNRNEILNIEVFTNGYTFHMKDGKKYNVKFLEMGANTSKQLKNYINRNQNLSL